MLVEIQVVQEFTLGFLYNKLPRRRVNLFGHELGQALEKKFHHHWYPDQPFKGSAYRCLRLTDANDVVLCEACHESGNPIDEIIENLPHDLTIWIDPGEVSCRAGEKNEVNVLFSQKEKIQFTGKNDIRLLTRDEMGSVVASNDKAINDQSVDDRTARFRSASSTTSSANSVNSEELNAEVASILPFNHSHSVPFQQLIKTSVDVSSSTTSSWNPTNQPSKMADLMPIGLCHENMSSPSEYDFKNLSSALNFLSLSQEQENSNDLIMKHPFGRDPSKGFAVKPISPPQSSLLQFKHEQMNYPSQHVRHTSESLDQYRQSMRSDVDKLLPSSFPNEMFNSFAATQQQATFPSSGIEGDELVKPSPPPHPHVQSNHQVGSIGGSVMINRNSNGGVSNISGNASLGATQPVLYTAASFAQTKFGSTKLKTFSGNHSNNVSAMNKNSFGPCNVVGGQMKGGSKLFGGASGMVHNGVGSSNKRSMSPTEFSNYIKQRGIIQQQQKQQQMLASTMQKGRVANISNFQVTVDGSISSGVMHNTLSSSSVREEQCGFLQQRTNNGFNQPLLSNSSNNKLVDVENAMKMVSLNLNSNSSPISLSCPKPYHQQQSSGIVASVNECNSLPSSSYSSLASGMTLLKNATYGNDIWRNNDVDLNNNSSNVWRNPKNEENGIGNDGLNCWKTSLNSNCAINKWSTTSGNCTGSGGDIWNENDPIASENRTNEMVNELENLHFQQSGINKLESAARIESDLNRLVGEEENVPTMRFTAHPQLGLSSSSSASEDSQHSLLAHLEATCNGNKAYGENQHPFNSLITTDNLEMGLASGLLSDRFGELNGFSNKEQSAISSSDSHQQVKVGKEEVNSSELGNHIVVAN